MIVALVIFALLAVAAVYAGRALVRLDRRLAGQDTTEAGKGSASQAPGSPGLPGDDWLIVRGGEGGN